MTSVNPMHDQSPAAMARSQRVLDRHRVVVSNPSSVGTDDGGLARRQALRAVQDRMRLMDTKTGGMVCGECRRRGTKSPHKYRTWSAMRDHLINFHGIDHREVPA